MHTLLLWRHAKSSWDEPLLVDHDRPLNGRGHKAARRMARWMLAERLFPDIVLCSTAVRTRATWQHLVEEWNAAHQPIPPIMFRQDLYHATPSELANTVATTAVTARSVLVVGHNPGLEEWLAELIGEFHRFPTAALAAVELNIATWAEITHSPQATLRGLWRPRDLPPGG